MNTDEIKVLPEHLRDGFFGADTSRWKFNKENGLTAEEIEALIPVLRRMNPNTVWAIPEVDFPFGVKTPEIWADGVKIEVKTITDAKKFDRQVRNSKHQIDGGIVVVVDKTGEISLNDIKMAIKNTSNRRGVDNIFVQNGSIKFVTETKEKEVRELPTKGRAIMTSYTSIISQDARKVKELFDKKSQQYYHQTHKLAPESFNKPTKYWEQRSLQRTIEAEKLAKPYLARLRMEYRASSDRAIDQIRRIYETYFGEAGFDRQKLREITPSGDLSRYIKEVRSLGVALPDNYQYRVNREEFLHAQLWLEAQKLGAFEQNISNELYSKVINRSFERTFGDYGGRNAPFYPELSKNDYKKLFQNYSKNWKFEKNYPLSDQEKNILDRFWQETGGRAKIFAVRRVEKPDGVKMPDLIVDGKKVEIKQISSIRSVEAQVRKAQKQGVQGIIFEIKDSKEDPQKLLAEIKKRTAQAGVAEFAVYKNKATAAASYAGHDTVANTFRVAQNPEKVNILPNFARLNEQTMNEILDSKFHGKNFSTRIWGRTDRLAEELHAKLAFAIAKGEGWERTSREIRERFGVAQSSAERLIRTETNYFENRAELAAYQELGIQEFEFLAALDGRTSEICRHHHGKRYKVEKGKSGENIPPLHPNCRSTIVAVVPELERAPVVETSSEARGVSRAKPLDEPQTKNSFKENASTAYKSGDRPRFKQDHAKIQAFVEELGQIENKTAKRLYDMITGKSLVAEISNLTPEQQKIYGLQARASLVMTGHDFRHLLNSGHITGLKKNGGIDKNPLNAQDLVNIYKVFRDPDTISRSDREGKTRFKIEKSIRKRYRLILEVEQEDNQMRVVTFFNTGK